MPKVLKVKLLISILLFNKNPKFQYTPSTLGTQGTPSTLGTQGTPSTLGTLSTPSTLGTQGNPSTLGTFITILNVYFHDKIIECKGILEI